MSRIGKQPIEIPAGVEASLQDAVLTIKGPKGTLTQIVHPRVTITIADGFITVGVLDETLKSDGALWGLFGSLLRNMIHGVTVGYEKKLEIVGVGYKASQNGNVIVLNLGFTHPINFELPAGIVGTVEKNVITLNGFDKQLVGQVAANIRKLRKPEPYKGKGIRYQGEVIIRKAGKAAKKGE